MGDIYGLITTFLYQSFVMAVMFLLLPTTKETIRLPTMIQPLPGVLTLLHGRSVISPWDGIQTWGNMKDRLNIIFIISATRQLLPTRHGTYIIFTTMRTMQVIMDFF